MRPVLLEPGAVLAAIKDAARRASARWPAAILDRCCARRPAGCQAGTNKRPPVSRTKKHDEVGSTGSPSKAVSLLPMMNSEEAKIAVLCSNEHQPVTALNGAKSAPAPIYSEGRGLPSISSTFASAAAIARASEALAGMMTGSRLLDGTASPREA